MSYSEPGLPWSRGQLGSRTEEQQQHAHHVVAHHSKQLHHHHGKHRSSCTHTAHAVIFGTAHALVCAVPAQFCRGTGAPRFLGFDARAHSAPHRGFWFCCGFFQGHCAPWFSGKPPCAGYPRHKLKTLVFAPKNHVHGHYVPGAKTKNPKRPKSKKHLGAVPPVCRPKCARRALLCAPCCMRVLHAMTMYMMLHVMLLLGA